MLKRPQPPPSAGVPTLPLTGVVGDHGSAVVDTALALVRSRDDWIHRRVDTIEFVTDAVLRVGVHVDLTVPDLDPDVDERLVFAVPVVTARKNIAFVRVEIDADDGRSVSLLDTVQSQDLTQYLLLRAAEIANGDPLPSRDELADALGELVAADRAAFARAATKVAALTADLPAGRPRRQFERLVADQEHGFILFAAVPVTPGERLGLRFGTDYRLPRRTPRLRRAWDRLVRTPPGGPILSRAAAWLRPRLAPPGRLRRAWASAGRDPVLSRAWRAWRRVHPRSSGHPEARRSLALQLGVTLSLPRGPARSYHVEVTVPDGLEIVDLHLTRTRPADEDDEPQSPAGRSQLHGTVGHTHAPSANEDCLTMVVQPTWSGWIARTWTLLAVNAGLLWLGRENLPDLVESGGSVGLVLGLAGLPAAFVANPFTHDLQARVTRGRRLLAALSGAAMLAAALALVVGGSTDGVPSEALEHWWTAATVVAVSVAALWTYVVVVAAIGGRHVRRGGRSYPVVEEVPS